MDKETYQKLVDEINRFAEIHSEKIDFEKLDKNSPLNRMGLNSNQCRLLIKIQLYGPQRISQIAAAYMLKLPNVSKMANELVRLGLCKKINEAGKKAVYLDLSEEGHKLLADEADYSRDIVIEQYNKYLTNSEQREIINNYLRMCAILSKFP